MNTRISAKEGGFRGDNGSPWQCSFRIIYAIGSSRAGTSSWTLQYFSCSRLVSLDHVHSSPLWRIGNRGLTGLIGGLIAAYEFGFSKGNWVTGLTLPIGKAITGVVAGIIMRILIRNRNGHWGLIIVSTLLSYVPEAGFTALIFLGVFPMVFGTPALILYPVVVTILVKAFIEMFAEGGVISILNLNRGFTEFIRGFFSKS